eukprot:scaffold7.g3723.t1
MAAASAALPAAAEERPAPPPMPAPDGGLRSLEHLEFNNTFLAELPGDKSEKLGVYGAFWSLVSPTPTGTEPTTIAARRAARCAARRSASPPAPRAARPAQPPRSPRVRPRGAEPSPKPRSPAPPPDSLPSPPSPPLSPLPSPPSRCSDDVARLIGLDPCEASRPEFAMILSGNAPLPQARACVTQTYAQCYGGHQFGSWAGQLGDGRAICLGEAVAPDGGRWELQLKGAGNTPYSRMADGRAVLRSSLREFVASEAMHALGVPTTRALSLVGTGDEVMRDMFYSGNVQMEPGAVVCRVARSFLPASRGDGEAALVRQLADYVIRHHYPNLKGARPRSSLLLRRASAADAYAAWLSEVSERTARLVAEWHRVGFVHGVLNTDNMSVIGDTIDYGPYGEQPAIGQFNLAGLLSEEQAAAAVGRYADALEASYNRGMARKLGLRQYDKELAVGLMRNMYEDAADYTNTFRALSRVPSRPGPADDVDSSSGLPAALAAALGPLAPERAAAWRGWLADYRARLAAESRDDAERTVEQDAANPAIVPRNHVMVDIIGEVEAGNYEGLHRYLAALQRPYTEGPHLDAKWTEPAPRQCRLGVELLSCSS